MYSIEISAVHFDKHGKAIKPEYAVTLRWENNSLDWSTCKLYEGRSEERAIEAAQKFKLGASLANHGVSITWNGEAK